MCKYTNDINVSLYKLIGKNKGNEIVAIVINNLSTLALQTIVT